MKKITILLIAISLLWNFQSSAIAYDKFLSYSLEQEESPDNFEIEDLEVAKLDKEITISKYIARNIHYKEQSSLASLYSSITNPPPDFS